MRTFAESLKTLAEKMPEKFELRGRWGIYIRDAKQKNKFRGFAMECIDQDALDEILAEIGWEYEVIRSNLVPTLGWEFFVRQRPEEEGFSEPEVFSTKLEAARAALIAVVDKLWPN